MELQFELYSSFAYGQMLQPLRKLLINWADFRGELK